MFSCHVATFTQQLRPTPPNPRVLLWPSALHRNSSWGAARTSPVSGVGHVVHDLHNQTQRIALKGKSSTGNPRCSHSPCGAKTCKNVPSKQSIDDRSYQGPSPNDKPGLWLITKVLLADSYPLLTKFEHSKQNYSTT